MDQSTHDVRRAGWLNIITEYKQRSAGVSAKQWLADNGINERPITIGSASSAGRPVSRYNFLLSQRRRKYHLPNFMSR